MVVVVVVVVVVEVVVVVVIAVIAIKKEDIMIHCSAVIYQEMPALRG